MSRLLKDAIVELSHTLESVIFVSDEFQMSQNMLPEMIAQFVSSRKYIFTVFGHLIDEMFIELQHTCK